MELKGTKTEECLKKAFAGESQAATKYQYYASKAKKDGYEQIGSIFEEPFYLAGCSFQRKNLVQIIT